MLWALGQPVAALALACAFLGGIGLRAVVHRRGAVLLGLDPVHHPVGPPVDLLGALALLFVGTGWGRPAPVALAYVPVGHGISGFDPDLDRCRVGAARRACAVAAGPVAVLLAGEAGLAGFALGYPDQRGCLRLNYPSDVLRGVVGVTVGAQAVLTLAVGLLSFGLLALLPVPPLDGFRLGQLTLCEPDGRGRALAAGVGWPSVVGAVALLLLAIVPVGDRSPLLAVLDLFGTPLLRMWA